MLTVVWRFPDRLTPSGAVPARPHQLRAVQESWCGCARRPLGLIDRLSRRRGCPGRDCLIEGPLEILAAAPSRRMSRRRRHVAEGSADLPQAIPIEPAFGNSAPDGPAVGPQLTPADVVVTTFVIEDEKTDCSRHPVDEPRIDDEDAWRRSTLAGQPAIEHVPRAAAA